MTGYEHGRGMMGGGRHSGIAFGTHEQYLRDKRRQEDAEDNTTNEKVKTKVLYRRDYKTDAGYKKAINSLYSWEVLREYIGPKGYIYTVLMKETGGRI